jgi:hypothetical protein
MNRSETRSVKTTMSVSELCKDGIRVRLFRKDERLYLQVNSSDDPEDDQRGAMPCDPDVLASVLRGLTYQLASETGYCAIRRVGSDVRLEFQTGSTRQSCDMSVEQFSKLVSPVLPPRLRATLL